MKFIELYLRIQFLPHSKHSSPIIQTNWLMLAREIISGYNGNEKLLYKFVGKRRVGNVNDDGSV